MLHSRGARMTGGTFGALQTSTITSNERSVAHDYIERKGRLPLRHGANVTKPGYMHKRACLPPGAEPPEMRTVGTRLLAHPPSLPFLFFLNQCRRYKEMSLTSFAGFRRPEKFIHPELLSLPCGCFARRFFQETTQRKR